LAPVICGSLGERYTDSGAVIPEAFKWGFLAACIGMVISLIAFIAKKNKLLVTPDGAPVGLAPAPSPTETSNGTPTPAAKVSFTKILLGVGGLALLYYLFQQVLEFDAIGAVIFSCC